MIWRHPHRPVSTEDQERARRQTLGLLLLVVAVCMLGLVLYT